MKTECNPNSFLFPTETSRQVIAQFDGGTITSDGGGLLLREVERLTGILRQFSDCFVDHRDPDLIEHPVADLVAQRIYALALGYEDLNDHEQLRADPLLASLVGKADPTGQDRLRSPDRGNPLAGKSTLNRLELSPVGATAESRYKKIPVSTSQVEGLFVDLFLQAHATGPPPRIVLDVDAAWASTGAFLSRLLRPLLLSAPVCLLWRAFIMRPVAAQRYRCRGRLGKNPLAYR